MSDALYKPDLVVGDSLAVGVGGEARLSSNAIHAVKGAQPWQIVNRIRAMRAEDLGGKEVALSSGLTNSDHGDAQFAIIRHEIELLKEKGAHVRLMGISNLIANDENKALSPLNKRLQALAREENIPFSELGKISADGLHPLHYSETLENLRHAKVPAAEPQQGPHLGQASLHLPARGNGPVAAERELTAARTHDVQELLKQIDPIRYNLGKFGAHKDGVDGIDGAMTHAAIMRYEDDKGLKHDASLSELMDSLRKTAHAHPAAQAQDMHMVHVVHPLDTPLAPAPVSLAASRLKS